MEEHGKNKYVVSISNWKFCFANGEEILVDTAISESIEMNRHGRYEIKIEDVRLREDLVKKLKERVDINKLTRKFQVAENLDGKTSIAAKETVFPSVEFSKIVESNKPDGISTVTYTFLAEESK